MSGYQTLLTINIWLSYLLMRTVVVDPMKFQLRLIMIFFLDTYCSDKERWLHVISKLVYKLHSYLETKWTWLCFQYNIPSLRAIC
jgi:hypothetical protein